MTEVIVGRDAEKGRLWTMLSRYSGGVIGYYGMSGIGKTTLLDLFEQEIRTRPFTPYIARLDFADPSLHQPAAAFIKLIEQLETSSETTKRVGFLKRKHTESPLTPALRALQTQTNIIVNQNTQIKADRSSAVADTDAVVHIHPSEVSQVQLNEAISQFKLGIAKLPVAPPTPANFSGLVRPLVVVLADTLEVAPPAIIDWLKQLASPMFEESLLVIAAGQEQIEKLLTQALDRIDDKAARDLLSSRFSIYDLANSTAILRLARGIPRCIYLAGEFVQQHPPEPLETLIPDALEDHLIGDYLVRGILKRLPDSSVEKHLLIYGCVLRRWESAEQLRAVLFGVDTVRALIGESADIRASLGRLRERSFLDSGQPHATLRDLLLRDLQNEEPSLLGALHRSAADWYHQANKLGEAVYHLLVNDDWPGMLLLWREMLDQGSKPKAAEILTEIQGRTVSTEHSFELQMLFVESGLLLENGTLLIFILHLLEATEAAQRAAVETLARRIITVEFAPPELRFRLQIQLTQDSAERAQALIGIGEVLRQQDRYGEAVAAFEQARALCEQIDDQQGLAQALLGIGKVLRQQDRYGEAAAAYEQARALCEQIDDQQGLAQALLGIGEVLLQQDRYGEAAAAFEQARALCEQIDYQQGLALALIDIGDVLRQQDRYGEAAAAYEQGRALCEQIDHQQGLALALIGIGEVLRQQDRYGEAAAAYEQARALCEKLNNRRGLALALRKLGTTLGLQGRYREAAVVFEQARALCEQIDDQRGLTDALLGLAEALRLQNRYGEAAAVFGKARALCEQIDDQSGLARTLLGLGEVLRQQNRYDEAVAVFEQARALCEQIDDQRKLAFVLIRMGEVLRLQNRYGETKELLEKAYKLFEQINERRGLAFSLLRLATTMCDIGDYKQGLHHLEILELYLTAPENREFRDSITRQELGALRSRLENLRGENKVENFES